MDTHGTSSSQCQARSVSDPSAPQDQPRSISSRFPACGTPPAVHPHKPGRGLRASTRLHKAPPGANRAASRLHRPHPASCQRSAPRALCDDTCAGNRRRGPPTKQRAAYASGPPSSPRRSRPAHTLHTAAHRPQPRPSCPLPSLDEQPHGNRQCEGSSFFLFSFGPQLAYFYAKQRREGGREGGGEGALPPLTRGRESTVSMHFMPGNVEP